MSRHGTVSRLRSPSIAVGLVALGVIVAAAILAPSGLGVVAGTGGINDVVQLTTASSTISAATSSSGAPGVSATPASVHNSDSNVDSWLKYDWSTTPYYGSNTGDTSITVRGTAYTVADLLWFKQETVNAASTTTTAQYFSPLKLVTGGSRVTFTSAGNACTAWTGSPVAGWAATAAGSITFKYFDASSQTDDTPSTTTTFNWCADTTMKAVYFSTGTAYSASNIVYEWDVNSLATQPAKQYGWEFDGFNSYTRGNYYCLSGFTGSGTSATPNLMLCTKMPHEAAGSDYAKLYSMFDPPAGFPSTNQLGTSAAVTYSLSAVQWNPWSYTTQNTV